MDGFPLEGKPKSETVWEVLFAIFIAKISLYGDCVDTEALSGGSGLYEK